MTLPPWAKPAPKAEPPEDPRPPAPGWAMHPGLFRDVPAALLSAHWWEVRAVMPTDNALAQLLEEPSRTRGNLTPDELVAQSGLTRRLARQVLSPLDWAVIDGYHTKPFTPALRRRKLRALVMVLKDLHPRSCCPFRRLSQREALEWSGYSRIATSHHEWAQRYQCHPKTVARWRMADINARQRRHRPGIRRLLDIHLGAAEGALVEPFRDAGVIE